MPSRLSTIWELEPHTKAKHEILRRYLQAWLPIITRWNGRVVYIDGFAGPGIYKKGEEGSPIIALKEAVGHRDSIRAEVFFFFIEADSARFQSLQQHVATLPIPSNFKVHPVLGKFDETMTALFDQLDEDGKKLAPTFAFLDPFGFSHTSLAMVRRLMGYQRCEVLITFMYEEINRFLRHPDQPQHFDALFGCGDWRQALSVQNSQERKRFIHDLYHRQLREAASIRFVRSFEMVNEGKRTDYFLFFGTNSLDGLKKMKEAMWKVDERSGLQFSDATDLNQVLLFKKEPDYEDLKRRILSNFLDRTVTVEAVEEFVLVSTPYRETHYKRHVLKPMEVSQAPGLVVQRPPTGRRKGTFSPKTLIEFV